MTRPAPPPPSLPMGIDVVLRFHDPSRLHELDRALFSLAHQSFGPVRPIVATQNFAPDAAGAVRAALDTHFSARGSAGPTIVDVRGPPGADLRSRLINAGFAAARHRFIAILDYDDLMLEQAYERLTAEALRAEAAVAFGRVIVKYVRAFDASVYAVRTLPTMYRGSDLDDLLAENFCPIHSFVVDRGRVSPDDLRFDETLTRYEDYEFLLRLSGTYTFSFGAVTVPVGIYNWDVDGSNSIQAFQTDEARIEASRAEWDEARRRIEAVKRGLAQRPRSRPGAAEGVGTPDPC